MAIQGLLLSFKSLVHKIYPEILRGLKKYREIHGEQNKTYHAFSIIYRSAKFRFVSGIFPPKFRCVCNMLGNSVCFFLKYKPILIHAASLYNISISVPNCTLELR